ncbi:MAG: hypothetical protein J6X32_07260 [Salinivirgaceae bacterium]|nr:hypothetical protein [Salinivirgaceae bacterium]
MKVPVISVSLLALPLLMASCNSSAPKSSAVGHLDELEMSVDTSAQTIKFGNTLFSLPSPYHLTMMIKTTGAKFNESLLNPVENNHNYTRTYKKCVNLGVYGADLAYMNIYEQSPLIINLFSVIKNIANDLDLTSAFSSSLIDRVERNVDNADSLLHIMSNTYRDVDVYLKESQRQREGALVLAGGWIESMYIMTQLAKEKRDDMLIQRIGESKQPLENLIKILSQYYSEDKEIGALVDSLIELTNDFDGVEQHYTYVVPEIDIENKMTIVKSVTKVDVPASVLTDITRKVESIRKQIVS